MRLAIQPRSFRGIFVLRMEYNSNIFVGGSVVQKFVQRKNLSYTSFFDTGNTNFAIYGIVIASSPGSLPSYA